MPKPISFKVNVEPKHKQYQIMLFKVEEHTPGLHAKKCDCGVNFAAYFKDQSPEFYAFQSAVAEAAKIQLNENAGKPLTGPVKLTVTILQKRPKNHYTASDESRPVKPAYIEACPTTYPSLITALEVIKFSLAGSILIDHKQIVALGEPKKLYRNENAILIKLEQITAFDIDPKLTEKQGELF